MDINDIFEKLFAYYNVVNAVELSEKINTSQKTISNWKVRNSINAIKKKCRELEIYDEIFGDAGQELIKKRDNKYMIDIKPEIYNKIEAISSSYGMSIEEYINSLLLLDVKKEYKENM